MGRLFAEALGLPPEERSAWLEARGDADVDAPPGMAVQPEHVVVELVDAEQVARQIRAWYAPITAEVEVLYPDAQGVEEEVRLAGDPQAPWAQ